MLQQCYISGLERQEFQCLGLQLQPFTLGHANLLMVIDSPIATVCEGVGIEDVFVCAYVCSFKDWHVAAQSVESGKAVKDAIKAAKKKGILTESCKDDFAEYIKYYTAGPMRNDSRTGYAKVPWPWQYAWLLQYYQHMSIDQAWDTICSDAFAWNACRCAYNNDENLMDELEVDFYLSE